MSSYRRFDHHPPCPGGCNELADECACARPNPLGSMQVTPPRESIGLMELSDRAAAALLDFMVADLQLRGVE